MKNKLKWMMAVGMLSCSVAMAQQQSDIMSVSASTNVAFSGFEVRAVVDVYYPAAWRRLRTGASDAGN